MPLAMVIQVLNARQYKNNFRAQFDDMATERRWFQAEKLVRNLDQVFGLPGIDSLVRDIFPNPELWPSRSQIPNGSISRPVYH